MRGKAVAALTIGPRVLLRLLRARAGEKGRHRQRQTQWPHYERAPVHQKVPGAFFVILGKILAKSIIPKFEQPAQIIIKVHHHHNTPTAS